MSPIFVRPVREQLEHDRLIRHLVSKYKKKFETTGNVGDEQLAPVKLGTGTYYPDLVLMEGKKLAGVVEVETAESVNNLEAMAQWVPFSRSRVPFHLYVPVQAYDVARRFCESHQAAVTEIWTYRPAAEGFDLVRSFHDAGAAARKLPKRAEPLAKPGTAVAPKPPPGRSGEAAKAGAPTKPAAKPLPKPITAKPPTKPAPKAVGSKPAVKAGAPKAPTKPVPSKAASAKSGPAKSKSSKLAKSGAKQALPRRSGEAAKAGAKADKR